jgi:type I restriction enzyme R subunit
MTPESEAQTRRKRIDPLMKQLGWEIVPFEAGLDRAKLLRHAVTEHPTSSGPSDYVLFVKGKPLGALEAKRLNVGSEGVLDQAKRYSRDIEAGAGLWNGYRIPFLYSSNGQQHWFADVRRDGYVSRQLPGGLHAPEALEDLFSADPAEAFAWFQAHPIEEITRLRPYQVKAIESVEAALGKHRRDLMLTQSILAKAFRGELVPQDPNDEPAIALLERLKATHSATPVAKRRGRPSKAKG